MSDPGRHSRRYDAQSLYREDERQNVIATRIEVNGSSIERALARICDTVSRGETPLTTYSSIAGRDADVSVEHNYHPPADDETPPIVETTIYVEESYFAADAALTPVQYGVAPEAGPLAAETPADEPTRLSELGTGGRAIVETLEAVGRSVDGVQPYAPDSADDFDAICVGIYPNPPATAAFLAQFEVDEAIVYRPDRVAEGAT